MLAVMTRSLRLSAYLILLVFLPILVSAHSITVPPAQKECFFEDLHVHDKMTVTYQVGGGGHLDIDFWLTDPDGRVLGKQIRQSTGSISITAEKNGQHELCFSNQMSAVTEKIVSFNVHGIVYVGGGDDIIAPVEREVRSLANALTVVKDEQEYIVVRERTHRNTAESTNSRVKWWSILQALVLFSVVGWQIYYLKSFFEVKRVI